MNSRDNILKFIEIIGYSNRRFEKEADLSNGTLKKGKDISPENLRKIVEKFSNLLIEKGFYIQQKNALGKEDIVILTRDQAILAGYLKPESKKADQEPGQPKNEHWDRLIAMLEKNQEFLQQMVKSNLRGLATGQRLIRAQVRAIHQWDAAEAASGDPEKEANLKEQINRRIAENFGESEEEDIEDGDGM